MYIWRGEVVRWWIRCCKWPIMQKLIFSIRPFNLTVASSMYTRPACSWTLIEKWHTSCLLNVFFFLLFRYRLTDDTNQRGRRLTRFPTIWPTYLPGIYLCSSLSRHHINIIGRNGDACKTAITMWTYLRRAVEWQNGRNLDLPGSRPNASI